MDYQTQQFRLLPYLASSYALVTTGVSMMMMFMQVMGQIDEGNLESLPEVRGQEDDSLCPPSLLYTIALLSPSLPPSLSFLPSLPPSLSSMLPVQVLKPFLLKSPMKALRYSPSNLVREPQ